MRSPQIKVIENQPPSPPQDDTFHYPMGTFLESLGPTKGRRPTLRSKGPSSSLRGLEGKKS